MPTQQTQPLTQAHIAKIAALRQQTYAYITNPLYMPEWRQLKWSQFLLFWETAKDKSKSLPPYQKDIIDTMLNSGETLEDGAKRARTGLDWVGACTKAHDNAEKVILSLTESQLTKFDVTKIKYPAWPL